VKLVYYLKIQFFKFQLGGKRTPMEICLLQRLEGVPGVVRILDYFEKIGRTVEAGLARGHSLNL
jgi:hypothetical protein